MTTANIFDLADTWDDGATAFTGIKMDVTDTASGAGSKLMDLLVGGVSRFSVAKDGQVIFGGPTGPRIERDGADDVLAMRRGTNAQEFRVYNTFTDAANSEYGFFGWRGNALEIATAANGTGSVRAIRISTSSTQGITFQVGPSANHRFDLRTTYFGPSQWDNNIDLGRSTHRWRDLFVGRNVFLSGLPTTDPGVAGQIWNDTGTLKISAG